MTLLNFLGNFFPYQLNLLTKILTNNKIIEEILLIDTLRTFINKPFLKKIIKIIISIFFIIVSISLNFFNKMID